MVHPRSARNGRFYQHFLTPVPSLSWQMIFFIEQTERQKVFSFLNKESKRGGGGRLAPPGVPFAGGFVQRTGSTSRPACENGRGLVRFPCVLFPEHVLVKHQLVFSTRKLRVRGSCSHRRPCKGRPSTASGRSASDTRRRFFKAIFIKTIFLPRQARDKHRENSKNAGFRRRGSGKPHCSCNAAL